MDYLEYLKSLDWNDFSRYPLQGWDIYLHCYNYKTAAHKFLLIKKFNAVTFNANKLVHAPSDCSEWNFTWLPVDAIKKTAK